MRLTRRPWLLALVCWLPLLPVVLVAAYRARRTAPRAAWTERDTAALSRLKRRAAQARGDHEPDLASMREAGM